MSDQVQKWTQIITSYGWVLGVLFWLDGHVGGWEWGHYWAYFSLFALDILFDFYPVFVKLCWLERVEVWRCVCIQQLGSTWKLSGRTPFPTSVNWTGWVVCRSWWVVCQSWWVVCRSWWVVCQSWWVVCRSWWVVCQSWWVVCRSWWVMCRSSWIVCRWVV